jgi:ABC-type polar amino acid transport system ATPase subunit
MSGGEQQMLALARALMSARASCWSTSPRSARADPGQPHHRHDQELQTNTI